MPPRTFGAFGSGSSFQPKAPATQPAAQPAAQPTGGGLQFFGGGGGLGAPAAPASLLGGGGPATFSPVGGAGFGAPTSFPGFEASGPTIAGPGGFSATPRRLGVEEITALNEARGIAPDDPARFRKEAFRVNQLLGTFGFIADPSTFKRNQIPFIEARLNFENLLQAGVDRESALGLIQQQRDVIGQTSEQQLALETARRRLEQPEPFTPEEVSLQTGAIRGRAARGLEASQRQFQQDFARQGLAGSATSFQGAQLQQAADRQASDELQRFAIQNALQRDINEASAIDRLQGITGENELRQIALNQAISELLTAERGQFDLSSLAAKG